MSSSLSPPKRRRTTPQLFLRALEDPPTRTGSASEKWQCVAGAFSLAAVLTLGIVFMAVDVAFAPVVFSSVAGIAGWQIVNYVLVVVFSLAGLVISKNMTDLYHHVQRRHLFISSRKESPSAPHRIHPLFGTISNRIFGSNRGRPGVLSAITLRSPNWLSFLTILRAPRSKAMAYACFVFCLTAAFSAVSVFIVDFKSILYEVLIPGAAVDIATAFQGFLPDDIPGGLSSMTPLIYSSTLASAFGYSCLESFTGCRGIGKDGSVEFFGATFVGNTSMGFPAISPEFFFGASMATVPGAYAAMPETVVSTGLSFATADHVTRTAYATQSNFTCSPLNVSNVTTSSFPITQGVPLGSQEVASLYTINVFDGPCVSGNASFLVPTLYDPEYFDMQACSIANNLTVQFIAMGSWAAEDGPVVEAYSCSSPIVEYEAAGTLTSDGTLSITLNAGEGEALLPDVLVSYASLLSCWVSAQECNFMPEDAGGPVPVPPPQNIRSQREWTSVPLLNWEVSTVPNPQPAADFLPVFCQAMVASLGTFVTTYVDFALVGAAPSTSDVIALQVVKLGSPPEIGGPLLTIILVLLLAHGWLWLLLEQHMIALDPSNPLDMLQKVHPRSQRETVVAELVELNGNLETGTLLEHSGVGW